MNDKQLVRIIRQVNRVLKAAMFSIAVLLLLMTYLMIDMVTLETKEPPPAVAAKGQDPEVVDGIHQATGLIDSPGLNLVVQNCTSCHSSQLIIQNRMSYQGWASTIQWMQETQNLWDLGENEEMILTYLSTNYAPKKKGRRSNLENIEWYALE